MIVKGKHYRTVWMRDGVVYLINQSLLPHNFEIHRCENHIDTARAISTMIVRGAGAIGATAGYGMAQVYLEAPADDPSTFRDFVRKGRQLLESTRPTAQNLFYAIERVSIRAGEYSDPDEARKAALAEAERIAEEDVESCKKIGEFGSSLLHNGTRILTHCNAGWLGFADWGTALSPLFYAKRQGKKLFVWVDETRPRLQGARLTAWELKEEGIDYMIIADNASGYYMKRGHVDIVIVGSDRIALNGDIANKIGTYEKAVLAKENGIPFYVAAPTSTVDWKCKSGDDIPIEERSMDEVLYVRGKSEDNGVLSVSIAPEGSKAGNPAFDVTPAEYIAGIITEKGIVKPEELYKLKPEK